jgi:hypothetical protein
MSYIGPIEFHRAHVEPQPVVEAFEPTSLVAWFLQHGRGLAGWLAAVALALVAATIVGALL